MVAAFTLVFLFLLCVLAHRSASAVSLSSSRIGWPPAALVESLYHKLIERNVNVGT